jgi:RNA polymerase sigma-70 factor (ECF subfamily)
MVAVPSRGRADLRAPAPEAAATQALYERHGRQIYYFCLGRLRSPEEAEDATQSTFLNAFRGLQRGIEPEHESAWLYKIAENVCLTRARSSGRRRRVETPGDLDAVAELVPAPEPDADEIRHLPEALESMPEQQRRALLLREWQGLSYREIADELGVSQSAVETLLFRARRSLAAGLAEPPKRKRLARLRVGGDAGWLAALLKVFVFSGGGKVALVGVVAASSALGVAPGVRVALEDAVTPHMRVAKPVHHAPPAQPKTAVAPVVVAPVAAAPVVAPVERRSHVTLMVVHQRVRHDHGRHLGRRASSEAAASVPAPTEASPTVDASAPRVAPAEQTDNGKHLDRGKGHKSEQASSAPASGADEHGNGGQGHGSHQ